MVSAINAISLGYYTALANSSAYNMMSVMNSRRSLLSSPMTNNVSFGSLQTLSALDTQYELEMITNSLQYKMAQAMIKQLKRQQKESINKVDVLA